MTINSNEAPSTTDGSQSSEAPDTKDKTQEVSSENSSKLPRTQEELDRVIQERLVREQKKYEGFEDIQTKASQLDALQVEFDKVNGELTELKTAQDRQKLVDEVSKSTGIPANVLRGTTKEEIEAHAESLKAAFPKTGPVIPNQAKQPTSVAPSDDLNFVRNLFGKN